MNEPAREAAEQTARIIGDASAGGITILALFNALPEIAALVSIIWVLIRIWETHTVQRALGRKPIRRQGEE